MAESNKENLGGDSMKVQLHQQPNDVPPDNVATISGVIRGISQEQADDMLRNLREHIILMTMFNHFEDVDNIDLNGKDGWDAIKAKASWDTDVLNALGIIAGAYIETHGGTDAITIASGKTFVPTPEAEADLIAVVDDYIAFHNSSGTESHVDTAQLFTENYFNMAGLPTAQLNNSKAFNSLALAKVPNRMVVPNNKLVNSLTRATRTPEDIVEIVTEVSKRGAKNKVTATCILSYEGDDVKISGRQPFTEYDRNVYNAVVSLYVAGNRTISSDMVWRTMTGKTEQEKPTPGQKAAVTKSIDKMRFMRARIDCSDEFKMRRLDYDDTLVNGGGFDNYLLNLSGTWIIAGNNTIWAYEFPRDARCAPILYQYSAAVKQVINVPIALLDVKKLDKHGKPTTHSLEYTERRVILKGYLLRRIEGMRGRNALQSRNIAFMDYTKDGHTHEGIYSIAGCPELSQPMPQGITDAEKTKRKNDARYIREDAAAILGYWVASGYIKGFSVYRDGRAVAGFEIKL